MYFKKNKELIKKINDVFNIFYELSISMFSWENLPSSINERYIEKALFENGSVAFFKDDVLGYLCLKSTGHTLDVFGEDKNIMVYGENGSYNKQLINNEDCIVIYNNISRLSSFDRLKDFAKRIVMIENTIDININAQKTPHIFKGSKSQELSLQNFYKKYDGFTPAIFVDDSMDINNMSLFTTTAPFVSDKLEEQKRKLWNEALSLIGIENNFSEKNERLTVNEVLVSNGLSIACKNSKLIAREKAIDKINNMFNLDIKISTNNLSVLDFTEQANDIIENVGGGE